MAWRWALDRGGRPAAPAAHCMRVALIVCARLCRAYGRGRWMVAAVYPRRIGVEIEMKAREDRGPWLAPRFPTSQPAQNSTSSSSNSSGSVFGGGKPFLHQRHCHDGFAICGAPRIELYIVGEEAGDDGRVHGVGHARLFPEQVGSLGGGEAFAPDGEDAIDVGLRARPHLEAGIMGFEIHRQR